MKKFPTLLFFFLISFFGAAQKQVKYSSTILLIPLDDRPPCLQFTEKMGLIGNARIISPPKELLGKFTTAGQADKIIKWITTQDLKLFDAAIISVDMIVYGGLVASRVHDVKYKEALGRMEIMRTLRKKAPLLPVYAQSVIMRLAPTANGKNDAYRSQLSRWAEISVATDENAKTETASLEKIIPREALEDYVNARARNLQINLKAIDFVRTGIINYLILSQDDAKPNGIHVADRNKLIAETKRLSLTEKIAIQPGADEVSMLLLARALNKHYNFSPAIKAIYSSDATAKTVMPFEDRPLRETVSYHIKASGCREVENEKEADLLFYVFASRFEVGRAESFAEEIDHHINAGKAIMVADIDPKGDVQGGDSTFTYQLATRKIFPELNSYASWNTAGNTIGTTLPQGVIFKLSETRLLKNKMCTDPIWTAQNWFIIHRVLDDYYFHTSARRKINSYLEQKKSSSSILTSNRSAEAEDYGSKLLEDSFNDFVKLYSHKRENSRQKNIECQVPSNLTFKLPWNRTFEAEISFDIKCWGK